MVDESAKRAADAEHANREAAKRAADAEKERRETAYSTLQAQRATANKAHQETVARMESSTPTPTQEENDMAKLGILDIDKKQDDGSGPELVHRTVVAAGPQPGEDEETYRTRQMRSQKKADEKK